MLDILASHPSTARFIATKLARRFVADEPPKALVDRAAAPLPRNRRQHPRGRADDRHVAGVLRRRGLSRQGQDAVRVRRQRRARDRHRHRRTRCRSCGGAQPRNAALWLSAADRLRRQGRGVGQHRRAPQPHELRRLADRLEARAQRGRWRQAAPRANRRPADRSRARHWWPRHSPASCRRSTAATVAKARRRRRRSRWCLGLPEFQRR